MGDSTGVTVEVQAPREYMRAIDQILPRYDQRSPEAEDLDATEVHWQIWEISCGRAEDIARALDKLMEEGDEDEGLPPWPFAYYVWEDPAYEWLGQVFIRVPLPDGSYVDHAGDCDAEGCPVVESGEILAVLREAQTLEGAREEAERLVGERARDAWRTYEPTPLPEQLTIAMEESHD